MVFRDQYNGEIYTLAGIKRDWESYREEDPENHCETFVAEMFEILMATVNGRNELEIIGLTSDETGRLIDKLREKVLQ